MLEGEPDAVVFPGLSRRSLRRAMMTPGVREFDAATILWRTEQGDLARDFRQPALRALFDACFERAAWRMKKSLRRARPVDEIIHPWLIRLCSVFLDQGMAYWPMPHREQGFYESVRTLLGQPRRHFPALSARPGRRVPAAGAPCPSRRRMPCSITSTRSQFQRGRLWDEVMQAELLALPGWAGLMRTLEENPGLAPHEPLPCSLMDFLAVRAHDGARGVADGRRSYGAAGSPLKTQEKRRLSRAARIYDAARVVSLSADEINRLSDAEWAAFVSEVKTCNGLERRRILHLAYERWHEREILRGLREPSAVPRTCRGVAGRPAAQVFFCIDEREESMRRALEEAGSGGGDLRRRRILRRRRGLQGNRRLRTARRSAPLW